ncbi:hypothetical protein ACEWY4_001321 [Coilia grayii]|uniref:RNA-directed DNA polymerase n=1 Tax=Coilia grayii TaxID=363190 RepID=A0ABD1KTQ1_9TELE
MDPDHSMDYDHVKEAILHKYEINEETYRRRFREPDIRPGETPRELYTRLKDLFHKWIRPAIKSVEDICETLIMEQFLRTLAPDIRVWVKEHHPQTGQRAAELVEDFVSARQRHTNFCLDYSSRPAARGRPEGFGQGGGQQPSERPRDRSVPFKPKYPAEHRTGGPVVCHYCNKEGHIKRYCPVRKPKEASYSCLPRPEGEAMGILGRLHTMQVMVNGKETMAVLDTGSNQTLVQPHLVEKRDLVLGKKVSIVCVNGDEHDYPAAEVYLEVEGQIYQLTVGVVEKLSHPVLMGQDVLLLPELIQSSRLVNMVITRSQKAVELPEKDSTKQPSPENTLQQLPFADCNIESVSRVRMRKSRQQRRQDRLEGTVQRVKEVQVTQPDGDWGELVADIKQLQKEDDAPVRPQQDKVEAVQSCQRPQTKKDVRSFLGLVGWYRRFIPDFASRAAPLTDLTRKGGDPKVQWGEEQERAFMDLKGALCKGPVLQSPNFKETFTVHTDASSVGLGAVLLQGEGENQRPVAFISRKLFPRETRYAAVELECLAVKWALDSFRYYLLGRDFTLETDHRALQWLGRMKDTNARITRWFLALQPYRFTVRYRAGKQNTVADFLSRHPCGETPEGEGSVKRKMQWHLMLCYALVLMCSSMAYARPAITGDMVKNMAKTTISRIKKMKAEHFDMSPEISFSTYEDTPIEGLTSMVSHLSSLQIRLRVPHAHHLNQVEQDVDTLLGYLRGMAMSQDCTLPQPASTLLKSEADFPITSNYLSLLDLQRYLEKLCLNLDKLKSC